MQEDDLRASGNIEDRRGFGMGGVGAGGLGIGAVLILTLIGWVTGINPSALINGAEEVTQNRPAQSQQAQTQRAQPGAPSDETGKFVGRILGETRGVWGQQLPAEAGRQYENPVLALFSGATQSGCGTAQSAM